MCPRWRGDCGAVKVLFAVTALSLLALVGCSPQQAASAPDPQAVLQAIPSADGAQYGRVQNMKEWRNPYLIVRRDGVALLDAVDNAEIILKPEEVSPRLARLPASNWPYGRVVAVAEGGAASEQDGVAMRRNKGIVGGLLEGAHVAVKWVPSN